MGRILVSEFTTLDGVIGVPTFTFAYPFTEAMGAAMSAITAEGSEAVLFGRTTWVESAPVWTSRDMADDPGAPFFNDTPKHVVSSTLTDVSSWPGSSVLGAYDVGRLQHLKDSVATGIYCYGSGTLVRALLADGLVDELHLFVYPVALGNGPKLFPEGTPETTLALAAVEFFENGVVHLTYTPVR